MDRQSALAAAKKKNADTVAWLYIPGAEVDDPVMQAEDNGHYLWLGEDGEYSTWGCYYAHCENKFGGRDKLDANTTIFGHSASNCDPNGPKLTKLYRYMDADYVKKHPYIYLSVAGKPGFPDHGAVHHGHRVRLHCPQSHRKRADGIFPDGRPEKLAEL